jgi:hypothetical protein
MRQNRRGIGEPDETKKKDHLAQQSRNQNINRERREMREELKFSYDSLAESTQVATVFIYKNTRKTQEFLFL